MKLLFLFRVTAFLFALGSRRAGDRIAARRHTFSSGLPFTGCYGKRLLSVHQLGGADKILD